jgi:hypothetical protein
MRIASGLSAGAAADHGSLHEPPSTPAFPNAGPLRLRKIHAAVRESCRNSCLGAWPTVTQFRGTSSCTSGRRRTDDRQPARSASSSSRPTPRRPGSMTNKAALRPTRRAQSQRTLSSLCVVGSRRDRRGRSLAARACRVPGRSMRVCKAKRLYPLRSSASIQGPQPCHTCWDRSH